MQSNNFTASGSLCFDTICNIPNDFKHCWLTLQTNMCLFSLFYSHSHAYRETSQHVTYQKTTPSQAQWTVEFLWNELPIRRCILLI